MNKLQELRGRMTTVVNELEPLTKLSERTDDQNARFDVLLLEFNDLKPAIDREIDAERAVADARARITEPTGQRASGLKPEEGAEEHEKRDHRSPMQRFLESDEYKRAKSHPKQHSDPVDIGSFHTRNQVSFGDGPIGVQEVRALLGSATASASMLQPEVLPTIYRARERDLVLRDVLVNAQTASDAIVVLQELLYTNNAAEVSEATSVSGTGLTGGVKPESALTFQETSFPVRTIAHWVPITRQLFEDLPFMQTYIEDRLRTGLMRREDNQFLNGNGTPPNLTGLLNTSGIQVLDAAYFTGAAVVNVGQDAENYNRILRARTLIRTVGGATANFVVINPADYEEMLTLGDSTRQYYGPGPFTAAGITNLWGLSVVESENIAAGTALVGDGLMAAVVDRMDARIYTTDSHSDFFVRNILVILAEERVALPVFRPVAFAAVTLA